MIQQKQVEQGGAAGRDLEAPLQGPPPDHQDLLSGGNTFTFTFFS